MGGLIARKNGHVELKDRRETTEGELDIGLANKFRGLAVAKRLVEDPTIGVLVLEAGPNVEHLPEVFVPGLTGTGQSFTTLNQESLNGRVTTVNAGKVLGGSTVRAWTLFQVGCMRLLYRPVCLPFGQYS
ncbi:hypothetical protein V5O48_009123 [Marasmius crinis-equi]|uniref:Uncharacterized protein n=1 Tax=Marasmius crinis-equi TaxID=585013 RepID=A0ABR3FBZ8_9AGAR